MAREKFEVVGMITVDAGIVQVGDPCYMFKKQDDWMNYLEKSGISGGGDVVEVPHENNKGNYGDCSSAVVVQSGFGDGVYPVEVKRCPETGVIKELRIKFFR